MQVTLEDLMVKEALNLTEWSFFHEISYVIMGNWFYNYYLAMNWYIKESPKFSEKALRPGSDANIFMSQTQFLEFSTWKDWHLNQFEMAISVWNSSLILSALLDKEFCLHNTFGTALIQMPYFSCANLNV